MTGRSHNGAAGFGFLIAFRLGYRVGWEKFLHGELDSAEDGAGVLVVVAKAFLAGNAVVVGRDEKLAVPLQTDDGKLTEVYVDPLSLPGEGQLAGESGQDGGGDICTVTAVAVVGLAGVPPLHAEDEGIHRVHHGGGQIALGDILLVEALHHSSGGEYFRAPFAAEEDDALVKYRKPADGNGPSGADKGVCGDAVKVADVHGVETAVEAYGLHIDVRLEQFSLTGL